MRQRNAIASSSVRTSADIRNTNSSASKPISIRTDAPCSSRYADSTMPSDVPELTYDYDHEFATPQSASSPCMIPTPVYEWNTPLADEVLDGKSTYRSLLEDWPPCGAAGSYYQTSFSSPSQSTYSSPTISRSCAMDGLDELNWEKQRYDPLSPSFVTTSTTTTGHAGHTAVNMTSKTDPHTSYPTAPTHTQKNSDNSATQAHYDPQHPYLHLPATHYDTPCTSFGLSSTASSNSSNPASICNTISPCALVSASTSPSLPIQAHILQQPPLKLHQPRPSRRIPIISLAELALAGEDKQFLRSTKTRHPRGVAPPGHPYPRMSPVKALSPLPLDCHGFSPISPKREIGQPPTINANTYQYSQSSQLRVNTSSIALRHSGHPSKFVNCSCGCMESYPIQT